MFYVLDWLSSSSNDAKAARSALTAVKISMTCTMITTEARADMIAFEECSGPARSRRAAPYSNGSYLHRSGP
jgi:hypothetical protein